MRLTCQDLFALLQKLLHDTKLRRNSLGLFTHILDSQNLQKLLRVTKLCSRSLIATSIASFLASSLPPTTCLLTFEIYIGNEICIGTCLLTIEIYIGN